MKPKTKLIILITLLVTFVGVALADIVYTYKCASCGTILQSTSVMAPRCPQCGGIMYRQ